ncbi:glycosyltransferase family 2 protein [Aeromonas sp. QDB30]|uniref:glycosyltransferase family 2 protein n=1 Tax=Aeromonas sp. QDB30 TaxID=2989831 RepID=UPI0022E0266A|nr:glycosyltransferase family 2 protein [Aeromonas sp. QDB30]
MRNKLAICAIFKNEGLYVQEWLDFHYLVGVGKFYIYLNNCDDDTYEKITSWKHNDLVDICDWPIQPGQLQAYQHCINRNTDDEWIAFIDSDEFLHSRNNKSIIEILDSIPSSYTTVVVNWLIFGSSGIKEKINKPVLETFTKRAEFSFPANRVVKSIIRSNCNGVVRSCHFIETSGEPCYSNGLPCDIGHDGIAKEFCSSHLILNHYFTKSHQEWTKKKLRGRATISSEDPQKIRAEEQFFYHDRNEVEDLHLYSIATDTPPPQIQEKGHLYIDRIELGTHNISLTGWSDIEGNEILSIMILNGSDEILPDSFIRCERPDVLKAIGGQESKKYGFKAMFPINNGEMGLINIIAVFYNFSSNLTIVKKIEVKI